LSDAIANLVLAEGNFYKFVGCSFLSNLLFFVALLMNFINVTYH